MKRLMFLFTLISFAPGVFAQSGHIQTSSAEKKLSTEAISDTSRLQNNLIEASDTLTQSDYIMSIDRVNDNLNTIRDSATLGFEIEGMKQRVDEITNDIQIIRLNTRGRNSVVNIKNLSLYQSFALHLEEENSLIQTHIAQTYDKVYNAKRGLKTVLSDSVFRLVYASSYMKEKYSKNLIRLERKWHRTDSTSKANIDTLNQLKAKIADNSMNICSMLNLMEIRLDKAGKQLFGREVNYLWQKRQTESLTNVPTKSVKSMLGSENSAIGYYFSQTSGKRIIVLFLGVFLFTWLFTKRKLLRTLSEPDSSYSFLNLHYLNSFPVLSLVALLLCLMPFFDAYAPTSYITIEFIILFAVTTVIFLKKGDLSFRFNWIILGLLLLFNTLSYLMIEPTLVGRLWLLAIHVCIIMFTLLFYRSLKKSITYYKWIKRAAIAGIILSGLGIICNLLGRFSLAGMFGIASIFAVIQAVILTVFIETIMEIVLLQLQSTRVKKGFYKPFDCSIVINKIKMPLSVIAIILWLIMLTSNLNIFHSVTNTIVNSLTTTRTIGNIDFRLISLLYFFIIIWLAHISQKLISFLFGETGTEIDDSNPVSKKQHSRLLIMRLLVLVCGYLIAIAASGLPLDKLTLLLGALGVGIGMGLQNVVNNFVSGIILIFDGSLQIGDEIEVSGQAGKVKEIGLRASTLSTADGAEVIIPNGNILSQNIVNWTFSNDQKRINIWFVLTGKELDSNVINEVINETIKEIPNVISEKKPIILFTRVTPENCTITVRFWSTISKADIVKSEAMLQLSTAFALKKIQFE